MAKKKELNDEALSICEALKIALSMDKDANCVTHNGRLITATPLGTVYTPFTLHLGSAFKAQELYDALNGCDKPYSISEDMVAATIKVSWGRKRATLKTLPKVSIYAPPIDEIQNDQISPDFKKELHDYVADLIPRANDVTSSVVAFDGYEAYWTNRQIAAKFISATWLPPVYAFVNDLRVVTGLNGNIIGIGGTAHSITFHFDTLTAVQISLADDSSINYPKNAIKAMFNPDLFATKYALDEEFIDAIAYVSRFAEDLIYISAEHVGTDVDPAVGTSVEQSSVPLKLLFFANTIKLGAFKGADHIVKMTDAQSSVGFMTTKHNNIFAFVRVRERVVTDA